MACFSRRAGETPPPRREIFVLIIYGFIFAFHIAFQRFLICLHAIAAFASYITLFAVDAAFRLLLLLSFSMALLPYHVMPLFRRFSLFFSQHHTILYTDDIGAAFHTSCFFFLLPCRVIYEHTEAFSQVFSCFEHKAHFAIQAFIAGLQELFMPLPYTAYFDMRGHATHACLLLHLYRPHSYYSSHIA